MAYLPLALNTSCPSRVSCFFARRPVRALETIPRDKSRGALSQFNDMPQMYLHFGDTASSLDSTLIQGVQNGEVLAYTFILKQKRTVRVKAARYEKNKEMLLCCMSSSITQSIEDSSGETKICLYTGNVQYNLSIAYSRLFRLRHVHQSVRLGFRQCPGGIQLHLCRA